MLCECRTRSTNLLGRTFVEVRPRTKIIGRLPSETSALSLIGAVLELASRGWRGVTMTPKAVAQIERIRRNHTHRPNTPHKEVAAASHRGATPGRLYPENGSPPD